MLDKDCLYFGSLNTRICDRNYVNCLKRKNFTILVQQVQNRCGVNSTHSTLEVHSFL